MQTSIKQDWFKQNIVRQTHTLPCIHFCSCCKTFDFYPVLFHQIEVSINRFTQSE